MIGLILAFALAGAQDAAEVWTKVDEAQGATIEIANLRLDGPLRRMTVRARRGHGMVRFDLVLDCKAMTAAPESKLSRYADGQLIDEVPFPDKFSGMTPVAPDPVAGPVATFVCPK